MINNHQSELPLWKILERGVIKDVKELQLDAASAITKSEVRAKLSQILTGVTVVALFGLMVAAKSAYERNSLNIVSSAKFGFEHAMVGNVQDVNRNNNTLIIELKNSTDQKILGSGVTKWNVSLPPGSSLATGEKETLSICAVVPDIDGNFQKPVPISCADLVYKGRKLMVEYLTLSSYNSSMIANRIIGQLGE